MAKRSVRSRSGAGNAGFKSILRQIPGTANPHQVIQTVSRGFDETFAQKFQELQEIERVARDHVNQKTDEVLLPKTPSQARTRKRFLHHAEEARRQKELLNSKEKLRRADKLPPVANEILQRNLGAELEESEESAEIPAEASSKPNSNGSAEKSTEAENGNRNEGSLAKDSPSQKERDQADMLPNNDEQTTRTPSIQEDVPITDSLPNEEELISQTPPLPKEKSLSREEPPESPKQRMRSPAIIDSPSRAQTKSSKTENPKGRNHSTMNQGDAKFMRTEIPSVRSTPSVSSSASAQNMDPRDHGKTQKAKMPERKTRSSFRHRSPVKRAPPVELSKAAELRIRRNQEAERKRQEEAEMEEKRKKKAEQIRRQAEEHRRLKEREAERIRMIAQQKQEEKRLAAMEEKKLKVEREIRERVEKEKREKEIERQKQEAEAIASAAKAKTPKGPKTSRDGSHMSQNDSVLTDDSQSYEMTPARKPQPSTDSNYGIDDLQSEDETDDESNPRKKVPHWAKGAELKAALIRQQYEPPNVLALFGPIYDPELSKMFRHQRSRFRNRTSSAYWDSPLLKKNPGNSQRSQAISS